MDLWQKLSATGKHVVMYGMGNGADKILSVCDQYGIVVEDFFASDDFVRGQQFHGKTVRRFDELIQTYGADNMIVLVAFASCLPEVMAQIERIAQCCELYVPDVPVRGDTVFCEAFEQQHAVALAQARELLADERSREVFDAVLHFRRTGELAPLLSSADDKEQVMASLLHPLSYQTVVDVGAYDGDTVREMLAMSPGLRKVWALEPDRRNFRKLSTYAEAENRAQIQCCPIAAWSEAATLQFDDSGNRNAGIDCDHTARRVVEVEAVALDMLLHGESVDYIKYDVEGSEKQALEGSRETIVRERPDILLSLYHRTEDLHALILQLHAICPTYRLYLRRYPYIPAWDLNLFATIK